MAIKFREFKKLDSKRCSEIIKDALEKEEFCDKPKILKEYNAEGLLKKSKEIHYFVIIKKSIFLRIEVVVGLGGIKDSGELKTVYIDPQFQEKGFGRELMKFLEKKAREMKLKKLFLWSAQKQIDFYKGLGYELRHKNKDDTYMEKELK
ncbi:GNAT family N-acetyltransferase [Candidatus Woesearchaeota archaeon]|nr:GNAT family N-acetyltransferase [Candidatus Woesearchaeota archaeon]